jgi:hypothetical protein
LARKGSRTKARFPNDAADLGYYNLVSQVVLATKFGEDEEHGFDQIGGGLL